MRIIITILSLVCICSAADRPATSNRPISVGNLSCEYLQNPLGIDVIQPRLSWKLISNDSGQKQTAWQILVSASRENLDQNIGEVWDSGRIESDQSNQVYYNGQTLAPRNRLFWKVRVWDKDSKVSAWSDPAYWEMGLTAAEWQAKWIGDGRARPVVRGNDPAPYFRKEFKLTKAVKQGRVYISGLGYYELYINGKKVGDHVLSPNHTNYDRRQGDVSGGSSARKMMTRVLYETYDVTDFLHMGDNVVAVCLGNGWYFQNDRAENDPYSYDLPKLIAQLEIELSNGTRRFILSDESWKTASGPLLHNGVHDGEIYDARQEITGWNQAGFDDSNWLPAKVVRAPDGPLMAQMSPPDRMVRTIRPRSVSIPEKGTYRFDMGELISGWVRLKVDGPSGTEINLKFIEQNGITFGQHDTYILKGNGPEIWEPRFTWHAFRYVEVSGTSFPLTLENLEGRVVNTDVAADGFFESANPLFNLIWQNFRRTQYGNMHGGVPSDCPHRERRGYTGDGQIAAQAAIYTLDMRAFYTKWINDMKDGQDQNSGHVPNTVPYQDGGGGTAWGSAYVIVPWYMYLYYGDHHILAGHYDGMKKWIGYLENQVNADGIVNETMLGEWVPPQPTEIPPSFVSTAYYYFNLDLMSRIAAVLGKKTDAVTFREQGERIKQAFNRVYFNADSKTYSIGRQGANVFALGFDLVPAAHIEAVFANLVQNIEVASKGHFDTGMMATPLLLDVLTRYGRADLAYTVMNQRDFPSFGYAIDRGATTLWETWQGTESHSHPMFGSVCQWFFQALGGINADPDQPGFKHIMIRPSVIGGLKFVRTEYESGYGKIKSAWQMENEDLTITIEIPVNCTATVEIPAYRSEDVSVRGAPVIFSGINGQTAVYQVASGKYIFTSKNIKALIRWPMPATPVIFPADSVALLPQKVKVRILGDTEGSEIRYTCDGSRPDNNSPLYTEPFEIGQTAQVQAAAFKKGRSTGFISSSRITFIDPQINGLTYHYYEGKWEQLPDFSKLEILKSGKAFDVGLTQINTRADQFGLVFMGEIQISRSGDYQFFLNSNDGSQLFINNSMVVDNDGSHASVEKSGKITLTAGRYPFRLTYFQAGGGLNLRLSLTGPGMVRQKIPASMLFSN